MLQRYGRRRKEKLGLDEEQKNWAVGLVMLKQESKEGEMRMDFEYSCLARRTLRAGGPDEAALWVCRETRRENAKFCFLYPIIFRIQNEGLGFFFP